MPLILPSDVHVNTPLTQMSVAIIQRESAFIAPQVFPRLPVPKQSDVFYRIPNGAFHRSEMKRRAPGDEATGISYDIETDTYRCDSYALFHRIPDESRANADSVLDLDRQATVLLTQQALLLREKQWAGTFFRTGVWTQDQTGVAANPTANQFLQWNDANSTPIELIRARATAIHQRTGFRPNTLVLGRPVFDALLNHPDIVDRVKYGQIAGGPAMANQQILAQLFEVERVLVADAVESTAAEGLTPSSAFVLGKGALLCYAAPAPGVMVPTGGYMFSWTGMEGAGAAGVRIRQFREETRRSDRFEIDDYFTFKLISADLGQYFANAVA